MQFKTAMIIASVSVVTFAPLAASAHDNGYNHRHQSSNNGDRQLVGGAVGAVVGGVLGSQLAGNGARTEGSVLGAVVGGLAGASIAGNGNRTHYNGGYNRNTGYYSNGGSYYHSQPTTYYSQPRYYSQPTTYYSRPVYSQPVYSQPYYGGHSNYYGSSRPSVSISLNSGYSNGGYYSRNRGRSYGQRYNSYPRSSYRQNRRRHHGHR